MATLLIDRKVLTALVDDLSRRHIVSAALENCCEKEPCKTANNLNDLADTLRRDNEIED